jgi:ribosome maturation factor RimP
MNRDLELIVEKEVDTQGYDLVLLRQGGTRSRPVLEVRIDRRDGVAVSIADCVRVSRALEARLDAPQGEDAGAGGGGVALGGGRYELQVSSPGDARRLRPATSASELGGKVAPLHTDVDRDVDAEQRTYGRKES